MANTQLANDGPSALPRAGTLDMKLEVVLLPVSDVERAKQFYAGLGWRLDADFVLPDDYRIVQFTPPGSACSIQFGVGLTTAKPGSVPRLLLAVSDIDAARAELVARGVTVSEVWHRVGLRGRFAGPDPQRSSYNSFVSFTDPDGNEWVLQEIRERLPGR